MTINNIAIILHVWKAGENNQLKNSAFSLFCIHFANSLVLWRPGYECQRYQWTGSHCSLLVLACQVSTAMFWVQFRSMCLNHFNLPLLFLQLEAVIAEVRKCGPMTQDSQINSCLTERLPNMLWDIGLASSLCSGRLACPEKQRLSITYSLSSWQNVRNVDVKALTIPPLVLSPFFPSLY